MEKKIIQEYRDKILSSPSFQSSQNLQDLFRYLVDCSLKKKPPKETTIAIEVFGKDTEFNSNRDPIVRVYASKLRARLKAYYQDKGRRDKVYFEIPRGHYEILFRSRPKKNVLSKNRVIALLAALLGCALVTIIALLLRSPEPARQQAVFYAKHIFWDDFITSNKPINVVLADPYFYREKIKNDHYSISRNYLINTDEQLEAFLQRHPEHQAEREVLHPHFDKNGIWGLQYMLPVLTTNPNHFFFSLSSKLRTENLKTNPTIYMGSLVELRLLDSFMQQYGLKSGVLPNYISIYNAETDSTEKITYRWNDLGFHNDYALLAKFPGPNEQAIGIFASLQTIGNYAAAKYMANPEKLAEMEDYFVDKHGYIPRYFICIFEVEGFQRVDFEMSIYKTIPIDTE